MPPAGRITPNRCLLRAASGAVQLAGISVKRAIPSRLGRPLSPFHPPSRPHGGPTRPPLPLLVWTRRALSCLRKPPKQLSPGGRQVPLSPLEGVLGSLIKCMLTRKIGFEPWLESHLPVSALVYRRLSILFNAMILSCGCAASSYGDAQDPPRAILAAEHHVH